MKFTIVDTAEVVSRRTPRRSHAPEYQRPLFDVAPPPLPPKAYRAEERTEFFFVLVDKGLARLWDLDDDDIFDVGQHSVIIRAAGNGALCMIVKQVSKPLFTSLGEARFAQSMEEFDRNASVEESPSS